MTADVTARVHRVVVAAFGLAPEAITPETSQDSVEGWDSLTHVHLIAALETEFGISIDLDRAIEMTTVAALVAGVSELVV
jgi:acyl carrier protein